jgi:hypothetical protein
MGLIRGTIELTIDCPMSGHGRHACVSLRVSSADALYRGNSIFVIGPVAPEGD